MRQPQLAISGEESIRDRILAAAILTRNASRKDVWSETGHMDVVVVSLKLLINGTRPGLLMINTGDKSRRMRCRVMRRFL
jgi:hypothetical protein